MLAPTGIAFRGGWRIRGLLFGVYQWLALRLLPHFSAVVTTSPLLAQELALRLFWRRVFVLLVV